MSRDMDAVVGALLGAFEGLGWAPEDIDAAVGFDPGGGIRVDAGGRARVPRRPLPDPRHRGPATEAERRAWAAALDELEALGLRAQLGAGGVTFSRSGHTYETQRHRTRYRKGDTMKITETQLRRIIRQEARALREARSDDGRDRSMRTLRTRIGPRQPEAADAARRSRSLKAFVAELGILDDLPDRGRSPADVWDVWIDDGVLVIEFANGETLEPYISEL